MEIIKDNVFRISYFNLSDNIIELLKVKLNEYNGENVIDYRVFKKDDRNYIVGYERKHTTDEKNELEDKAKLKEERHVLNLLAGLGGRRI
ncbi:hypothetical protein [Mammaliicoccus sciuri]|uniref:hypothetical protein n=1 Tax=Mammaliicoccus sciuri TaxID=1296 RepID=UPI0021D3294D|nr:hypothetical protein [Mammaliicoccus sciuri]UXU70184.1 hypothetical protein MUA36_05745 [Mammaliicoccus sciuri]